MLIMIDKGTIAILIILALFIILISHWYDVFYIRKNHQKTTHLLFNPHHEFSTGKHKIRWFEATYIYEGGFVSALLFNRFPSRVANIKKKAKKRGHNSNAFGYYDILLLNENYKKIVKLNPVFMFFIKARLWLIVFIVISSIILINI